jgi:predicted nucleotidyltransferase
MSIAKAIFSESQSRLYPWLFGQPDRKYHLNEMLRLSGLGSASLQRELKKLTLAGLIVSERVGNLKCVCANPQSPIFSELVALTRKTVGLERLIGDALVTLQPRLQSALIYGSVAKRTDSAQSDIDLMIVGNDLGLNEILEHLLPVEVELQRKINPTCYTLEEFSRRCKEPDSFVNRLLAQPMIILIGNGRELVSC